MTYPASSLINEAYYVSGVVARGLESVEGDQANEGLRLLNIILSAQNITGRMIPYFQTSTLTAVVGQEKYFIPNLIDIEAITFNLTSDVRFGMIQQQRDKYFGTPRALNINSLPLTWHIERTLGGANLYLYFYPNQAYPVNYIGKFGLTDVELSTDLDTVYDEYYQDYLTYLLARRICGTYNIQFTVENERTLMQYEQSMRDVMKIDFSLKKVSTLTKRTGYSYADINLGRGYEPTT